MSKFSKLVSNPELFILDAVKKRSSHLSGAKLLNNLYSALQKEPEHLAVKSNNPHVEHTPAKTYIIATAEFSSVLMRIFSDRDVEMIHIPISEENFKAKWHKKLLSNPDHQIIVVGVKLYRFIEKFIATNQLSIQYLDFGFLSSKFCKQGNLQPIALAYDDLAPYFSEKASDLELLLSQYDFNSEPELIDRADTFIEKLLKFDLDEKKQIYGEKTKQRILILGQAEDDLYVTQGSGQQYSGNDLVSMAYLEHPEAQIIYKPHADVLHHRRKGLSNPKDVEHLCQILGEAFDLVDALEDVDQVYTISAPEAFEAIIRGIKVTTLGKPYYAGWGLTDDRQSYERRNRVLSLQEFVVGYYLKYLKYYDPGYNKLTELEDAFERLIAFREMESVKTEFNNKIELDKQANILESYEPKPVIKNTFFIYCSLEWRPIFESLYQHQKLIFLKKPMTPQVFIETWAKKIKFCQDAVLMIQSDIAEKFLWDFAQKNHIPVYFVREGLIDGKSLLNKKFSIAMDSKAPFNSYHEISDMENLLLSCDLTQEPQWLEKVKALIENLYLSDKQFYKNTWNANTAYGEKKNKRVLVIGEAEDDINIKLASPIKFSANELVELAYLENPDAQIIYKPFRGYLNAKVAGHLNPYNVQHICTLLTDDILPEQSLETIDHVYTLTSNLGFSALLRGIQVTTLGCPFYAGWGLTDDRQSIERRSKTLSLYELVAVIYFQYFKYYDPILKAIVPLDMVLKRIAELKNLKKREDGFKELSQRIREDSVISHVNAEKIAEQTEVLVKGIVPDWFNGIVDEVSQKRLNSNTPVFLYLPWIAEHTNALINKINIDSRFELLPLNMIRNVYDNDVRRSALSFAREKPNVYRKLLIRALAPYKNKVKGFIFTLDWLPVMRLIVDVCHDFKIPTILIPHESVFVNKNMYYVDPKGYGSVPKTDIVLSWGECQTEIYVERGYPESRIQKVGAPKFDSYTNYQPIFTREEFANIFNLDAQKKIVLFATQPLDSQLDTRVARNAQRKAIQDLFNYCDQHDFQFIIRMPPSKDDILGGVIKNQITNSSFAAIDDANFYLVSPEEAIYHADFVSSINSTMLFEGVLMGRFAFSMKYVEFEQIWEKAGIPAVHNYEELKSLINGMSSGEWQYPEEGLDWAAHQFGIGEFDGQASLRIRDILANIAIREKKDFDYYKSSMARMQEKALLDVVSISYDDTTLEGSYNNLQKLFNVRKIVSSVKNDLIEQASAEVFICMQDSPEQVKQQQLKVAKSLGKKVIYADKGFIPNILVHHTWYRMSMILDYTSSGNGHKSFAFLEKLLLSDEGLSQLQIDRSIRMIEKIISHKVSSYNHAVDLRVNIGRLGVAKVLVVDQSSAHSDQESFLNEKVIFEKMLYDATKNNPDLDIIIVNPEGNHGYLDEYNKKYENIFKLDYDVNTYSLLDSVEDVYVVSSRLGFEALLRAKNVHCYGTPFYAGWGLTQDKFQLERQTRQRTVEEIFHYAYIEMSRYFDPEQDKLVEIEEILDYVIKHRGW